MKMIAHQAPGMHLPLRLAASLRQGVEEQPAIVVIAKDGPAAISPVHDMVDRSSKLASKLSRHYQSLP
jgi:hypothetical protein